MGSSSLLSRQNMPASIDTRIRYLRVDCGVDGVGQSVTAAVASKKPLYFRARSCLRRCPCRGDLGFKLRINLPEANRRRFEAPTKEPFFVTQEFDLCPSGEKNPASKGRPRHVRLKLLTLTATCRRSPGTAGKRASIENQLERIDHSHLGQLWSHSCHLPPRPVIMAAGPAGSERDRCQSTCPSRSPPMFSYRPFN